MNPADQPRGDGVPTSDVVRDPLANRAAVLAARRRPMSERLELAVSWNRVASQLRVGLAEARTAERRR